MISLKHVTNLFSIGNVKPKSRVSNKEISEMLKCLKSIKNSAINIPNGEAYRQIKREQLINLSELYEIVSFAKEEVNSSSYKHNVNKKIKLTDLLASIKHERNRCFIILNKVGKSSISAPTLPH